MRTNRILQGLLPTALAAALFLLSVSPARAAEITEQTTQTAETPETVSPSVSEEITVPQEYDEVPETTAQTEPAETTLPAQLPEETVPEETVPEETEPPVSAAAPAFQAAAPAILTIADASAISSGTEAVTVRGTVVRVSGTQAVLQDDTGGIRLTFEDAPDIAPGDVLLVTGRRSGGLSVTDFEKTGTAGLPAVETTLLEAEDDIRILVKGAVLGNGTLCQNGFSMSLIASVPVNAGDTADVYGVIQDGYFYADTILPGVPSAKTADPEWNAYFGQLHAHTAISDGTGTVEEAFAYAANVAGLDFFAVTDHSNSLDNANDGAVDLNGSGISSEWAAGKAAAAAVTDGDFVGLFGYEMTWSESAALGHINTFHTPGWQSRNQAGFETLESYYEALAKVPGSVSQFNHPCPAYGEFQNFTNYDPAYDAVMHLLEVGSENGMTAYEYYTRALDNGWHVAPTNNQNNHHGGWGDISSVRTVVLAKKLTEDSLYDAMRSYRVYATEDSDLTIFYRLNGQIMGSIIGAAGQRKASVSISDPTDTAIGTVEVIADGGVTVASQWVGTPETELTMMLPSGYGYYYLRITQPDGDVAVTAPVWVDSYEDMGISGFTADTVAPEVGQEITLNLELYNRENTAFSVNTIQIFQNDVLIHEVSDPASVGAMGDFAYPFAYTWEEPGEVSFRTCVTGTVDGESRTYEQTVSVHYQPVSVTVNTIAEARGGTLGEAYCVQGYVTAGTSNESNTFPNTIYLQDGTGGIAVTGSFPTGIPTGAPMEVTGCLKNRGGNLVLDLTEYALLEGDYYKHSPRTMNHSVAMDYAVHGGELLQIEGEVVSLTKTADGKGIARFTIKDVVGDLATVVIEEEIGSGSYGTNELASQVKKGRTVRAMGLLHVDEYGVTVLRVRNCDEVVYVPPKADPTNPKTGDWLFSFFK